MTKSKEFEIRKLLSRLYIYNMYKYDLKEIEYYILMDLITTESGYKFEYIGNILKAAIKHNVSIKAFCRSAKVYEIRYNLNHNELLEKLLIE